MFINLKGGKLTLYDLSFDMRIQPVLEKMSYEGEKEHHTLYITKLFDEGRRKNNTIIRNMIYKGTGRIIEYNDMFYPDEEEYKVDYDLYKLPNIYLIIEGLMEEKYELLGDLDKYQKGKISSQIELKIFEKHQKEIYNYIYLRKILETDPSAAIDLLNKLSSKSNGQLKSNLKEIKNYLNIHKLELDGIKVKEKKYEK
jgi:hypothetical protein